MAGVFISYRRADSAGWAGRIYDRLADRVGAEGVFVDVEAIRPGEDFAEAIKQTLSHVDAVVVVIGPVWIDSSDEDGGRRLDDPLDVVRQEVAMALDRGVRLIPVLVDGARMPDARQLPEDIQALADRNAMSISSDRFDHDIERLLEAVDHGASGGSGSTRSSHNLPAPMTSFVGREEELASVADLLEGSRLVTLVGPGGVGKTRLALKSADQILGSYEDGVRVVELAPISDFDRVSTAVMNALGLAEAPGEEPLETLASWLAPREMLIVLDNCEHVIGSVADVVAHLLSTATGVTILATSREVLGVPGEHFFRVGPLLLPDATTFTVESQLMDYSAVRLFVERAWVARPGWELTSTNADAVAQTCTRLDGLPLAIELAAARLRMMPVEQISQRLDDRFRLLTGGSRTQLPRQQTLESAIDWSFELLSDDEQEFFSRLSVFLGGFTLEAAESVCGFGSIDSKQVLELLGQMVDKSLIDTEQREEGIRYRMLETLHQYAYGKFAESVEVEEVRRRHANYLLTLAAKAHPKGDGHVDERWLRRFDAELDNMRQALDWALTNEPQMAQSLVGWLRSYFLNRSKSEGNVWAERALDASDEPTEARGEALLTAALTSWVLAYERSLTHLAEAIDIFQSHKSDRRLMEALRYRAALLGDFGEWNRAEEDNLELLAFARSMDDRVQVAYQLQALAILAMRRDEFDTASERSKQAVDEATLIGSDRLIWEAKMVRLHVFREAGEYELAEAVIKRSAADHPDVASEADPVFMATTVAGLAVDMKHYDKARTSLIEAITWAMRTSDGDLEDLQGQDALLEGSRYFAGIGDWATCTVLLAAYQALHKRYGFRLPKGHERRVNNTRTAALNALGRESFEVEYTRGMEMGPTAAYEHLLRAMQADSSSTSGS